MLTNVGVIDFSVEDNFGRGHGVIIGEKELCSEFASFIASPWRAYMMAHLPCNSMKKCL
jgi:hypothetical protein